MANIGEVSVMNKRLTLVLLLLAIIMIPIVYLAVLNVVIPEGGVGFSVGWEDNSFQTKYSDPGWFDSNFTQGWSINWTNVNSGFEVKEGVADLYATFNGSNPTHPLGISEILLQKAINPVNTSEYPYLVIRHKESSSDTSLAISFSLVNENNILHVGSYYHTSTSWTDIDVNLSTVFSGIIEGIQLSFLDGYDTNYSGGLQHAYFQTIGMFKTAPAWTLAYNNAVDATLSSENDVLIVHSEGNLTPSTLVSAQRSTGLEFNVSQNHYLNVSIMTSGYDVAARIVIWTKPDLSDAHTVLLKTYNDENWHTEIVDLSYWVGSSIFMIELGSQQVYQGSNSTVSYRQVSFDSLEVG